MKTIGSWVAFVVLLVQSYLHCEPSADTDPLQRALFLSMLTDRVPEKSVLGARSLRLFYAHDELLSDAIAERLESESKTELRGADARMAQWHITLLGDSHNPRYRDVLTRVRERTMYKRLLSAIDSALKDIGSGEAAQYSPDTIKIAAVKSDSERLLAQARRTDHSAFDQIKIATPLADVLRMLGTPDDATAWTARAQKLLLHYADQGLFVLTVDHDSWVVAATYHELIPIRPIYNGERFGIAQALGSFHSRFLVAFMKSEHRQIRQDTDALAVLAKRVEVLPKPDGHFEPAALEKGMMWLAASNDPRAGTILQEVATTGGSQEAKDIAKKALDLHTRRMAKMARKPALDDDDEEPGEAEQKPGA